MSSANYRILKLHKKIDNRLCADCCAPLDETNQCYASLTFLVWICGQCMTVHKSHLGNMESSIKNVHEQWSDDEVARMEKARSNVMVNKIYERFIPSDWQRIDVNSSLSERKTWIYAKYYSMYFALPHHEQFPVAKKSIKTKDSSPQSRENRIIQDKSLPMRLVDFFVTVGLGKSVQFIASSQNRTGISPKNGKVTADSVQFQPAITCCYPPEKHYPDTPIPDLIGPIVFPNGLTLSQTEKAPFCFSFVMTNINRVKLYGTALIIYELVEPEFLKTLLTPSEASVLLSKDTEKGGRQQVYYAPKALTLISHYGYFHLYSKFLEQIYHVSLSSSPLPLERYIANFVQEVPLPPQGRTEVFITLPESMMQISRPPRNYLPMVDFSYRPLFVSLSVENILSVFSCLCAEMTICICSSNIALLAPVQEALLSLLFPFVWQGCYVPVLPAQMMELLDAPVPLLVGVHDSYLLDTPEQYRPKSVVFVHLDTDTIFYGKGDDFFGERVILPLPKQSAGKLKKKLIEFGECIYRNPVELQRLKKAGSPFPNNEHLVPIASYLSEQGVTTQHQRSMSNTEMMSSLSKMGIKRIPGTIHEDNGVPYRHPAACTLEASAGGTVSSGRKTTQNSILDPANNLDESANGSGSASSFNAKEIREAFLRFFVASFIDYQNYFSKKTEEGGGTPSDSKKTGGMFRRRESAHTKFAADDVLRFNKVAYAEAIGDTFLKQMIETQMFSNYISERLDCPEQAEIRFFDENILAKINRSKLAIHKNSTPFLSDDCDNINESFTVPGPSNSGIGVDQIFSYTHFPVLNEKLVGAIRVPRVLVSELEIKRVQGQSALMLRDRLVHKSRMSTTTPDLSTEGGEVDSEDRNSVDNADEESERELREVLSDARRRYLVVVKAVTTIQSIFRMRPKRRYYLRVQNAFKFMKRFVRMTSLRRMVTRRIVNRKTVVIQKYWRRALAQRRFKACLRMIVALQSCYRGRGHRVKFKRVRRLFIRVQSQFRGHAVRNTHRKRLVALLEAYRLQVLCLWELENTSLSYRSSFWITLVKPTCLHVTVFRDEIQRLYDSLGAYSSDCPYFRITSKKSHFEEQFSQVEKSVLVGKIKLLSGSGTSLNLLRKEWEASVSNANSTTSREAAVRISKLKIQLQEERNRLYAILKANETSSGAALKTSLFSQYHLAEPKKRKQRLVAELWTNCSETHATLSAQIEQRILKVAVNSDGGKLVDWAEYKLNVKMSKDSVMTVNAYKSVLQKCLVR